MVWFVLGDGLDLDYHTTYKNNFYVVTNIFCFFPKVNEAMQMV